MGVSGSGSGSEDDHVEPGSMFDCRMCGMVSPVELHDSTLWCGCCGHRIQEYDTTDYDRVQLDEQGRMSGRGAANKSGSRIDGSTIGRTEALPSSKKREWARLKRVNASQARGGPSRSKREAMAMIGMHAATQDHRALALSLLDIGWPDPDAWRVVDKACERPLWRPAHPYGVGSSAATCLHISALRMAFDSVFTDWVALCLPTIPKRKRYAYRALKRMRAILGQGEARARSTDVVASAVLSRANLGETAYSGLGPQIWQGWKQCTAGDDNLSNYPRPVLAALCEIIAKEEGLPVSPKLIEGRFNVGRNYQRWKGRLLT